MPTSGPARYRWGSRIRDGPRRASDTFGQMRPARAGPGHPRAMRPPIPDDVRRFILASVPSVPYLEAMLLLRAEPELPWDKEALARRQNKTQSEAEEEKQQHDEADNDETPTTVARWQPREELASMAGQ